MKRNNLETTRKPRGGARASSSGALIGDANLKLNETMRDAKATFVFTTILHLGLALNDWGDICEPLTEFLENLDEHLVKDLADRIDLRRVLASMDETEDTDEARSELAWCCREQKRWGFLCYVEAPETTRHPGGSKSVQMGLRHCRWFYGENLADVVQQAEAWALGQEKEGPIEKLVEVGGGDDDEDDG